MGLGWQAPSGAHGVSQWALSNAQSWGHMPECAHALTPHWIGFMDQSGSQRSLHHLSSSQPGKDGTTAIQHGLQLSLCTKQFGGRLQVARRHEKAFYIFF